MSPAGALLVPARIELCGRSHVGRVRARNEDYLAVRPEEAWAVLADGMGGYRGGDVAARLSVETVLRRLEVDASPGSFASPDALAHLLWRAALEANEAVWREAFHVKELAGMGATLVMAAFVRGCAVAVHVGDSRLYRWRAGLLAQLTRDHTMLQELVDGGIMSPEEAARSKFRGLLTRGLGVAQTVVPEVGVHEALRGDLFMLCSDGLTDMLRDSEIASLLAVGAAGQGGLDELADRLVEEANRKGGRDNVSVILARVLD